MRHYFFIIPIFIFIFIFGFSSVFALEEDSITNNEENLDIDTSLNNLEKTNFTSTGSIDDSINTELTDNISDDDIDNSESNNSLNNSDNSQDSITIDDSDYVEVEPMEDDEDNSEQLETDGMFLSMGYFEEPNLDYNSDEIENPETGDNILIYFMSLLLSPIFIIYFIRRFTFN